MVLLYLKCIIIFYEIVLSHIFYIIFIIFTIILKSIREFPINLSSKKKRKTMLGFMPLSLKMMKSINKRGHEERVP